MLLVSVVRIIIALYNLSIADIVSNIFLWLEHFRLTFNFSSTFILRLELVDPQKVKTFGLKYVLGCRNTQYIVYILAIVEAIIFSGQIFEFH